MAQLKMMNLDYQLILASNSPRRKELLSSLELNFKVEAYPIDESFPPDLKEDLVAEYIAKKKADGFRTLNQNELLITSDTVVINKGTILGKPSSKEEAFDMISSLSGNTHTVITGVMLRTLKKEVSFSESTHVTFRELSVSEIDHYINKYQPFDKAGAYGIQEWIGKIGIEKIEGDYYNVVGLPLEKLYLTLSQKF